MLDPIEGALFSGEVLISAAVVEAIVGIAHVTQGIPLARRLREERIHRIIEKRIAGNGSIDVMDEGLPTIERRKRLLKVPVEGENCAALR